VRRGLVVGAAVCFVLAALLVVFAADVSRSRAALSADDARYRAAPEASDLWNREALVPLAAVRSILGVDDDLEFRQAVRALRLAKLEEPTTSDTDVLLQRAEARERLEAIAASSADPARRSRAMTLLGVLLLATPVPNAEEQLAALKAAVTNLQEAIALDPTNSDAKYNLEFALRQRRGGLSASGSAAPNPSGSSSTTRGAATGPPGSGY
jgi:hypothetical protein